ncbi:MAG: hypothetical protein JWL85_161 [Candidatus Saccharibacteria bacterium]|nr:hypothetical protein [Candidatus Saccharibacteria bacterium]
MSKKKVIAFVGMPGAGKGTCTNYLEETHDWPVVHFGSMVYEEVQRRGLHNVRDEMFVRTDMREKEGSAVLAKHAARKAQGYFDKGHTRVVLDGLYSWTEYKYLEEVFGDDLIVVAITAPKALRRTRAVARKDGHRTYTIDQIVKREIDEIENLEKGGPIAYADHTILNDQDPFIMIETLEILLKELNLISK